MGCQERPDVICWQGKRDHQPLGERQGSTSPRILVALSMFGILVYPVLTLSWIAYCTRKFPAWLRSHQGLEKLEACAWEENIFRPGPSAKVSSSLAGSCQSVAWEASFRRFRLRLLNLQSYLKASHCVPQGYFYGFLSSVANLCIALIPISMVSYPALQLALMCIVLWWKQSSLCLLWPWTASCETDDLRSNPTKAQGMLKCSRRHWIANVHDLALSTGCLLLLNLVSPLLILDGQERFAA